MNADCWRTPDGRIGTEVARREKDGRIEARIVTPAESWPQAE